MGMWGKSAARFPARPIELVCMFAALTIGATASSAQGYVAGLNPDRRPEAAPRVQAPKHVRLRLQLRIWAHVGTLTGDQSHFQTVATGTHDRGPPECNRGSVVHRCVAGWSA